MYHMYPQTPAATEIEALVLLILVICQVPSAEMANRNPLFYLHRREGWDAPYPT